VSENLEPRKYDAVQFDRAWQPPGMVPTEDRLIAVMAWCEEAMATRRVHVHPGLGDGPAFVSKRPDESVYFATTHPRAGQPRYEWERHPSGCLVGVYTEGANG
jgi:hypothetical protein